MTETGSIFLIGPSVEIPEEKYAELVSIQALLDYILVQQTILAQQATTHWELTSA